MTAPVLTGNSQAYSPPPTPPASPVAAAIARHRMIVALCALALCGMGVLGGLSRKGTYTASSTLQVGKVNPNSPGFYGFVQSASDLATAFSRAITAAPVLAAVHKRLGLATGEALAHLSAEPLPNSPVFRIIATAPSPGAAIDLANVASRALITYEATANTYSPESRRLLSAYRGASLSLAHATVQVTQAGAAYAARRTVKTRLNLERAQASRAAVALETQALASGYQQSAQSATTRDLISLLAGAASASSDRRSKIELLGFLGFLGGLVIGCPIAVLLDRRFGLLRAR